MGAVIAECLSTRADDDNAEILIIGIYIRASKTLASVCVKHTPPYEC